MSNLYYKTSDGLMYYEVDGKGEPLVLLHGWGQTLRTFDSFVSNMKERYKIVRVDFIGFGNSDIPMRVLRLEDYVNHIKEFLKYLQINNPIILGHSFGGRVAIELSSDEIFKKVFLVSTPAFKNKSLNYYYKVCKYKILKKYYYIFNKEKYLYLINNSGSKDFKSSTHLMKGTLINIVRYDLTKSLLKNKNKIVILASVNDSEVEYKDELKMYKYLYNCDIYPFYKSNHFLYLTEEKKFIDIFIKEVNK